MKALLAAALVVRFLLPPRRLAPRRPRRPLGRDHRRRRRRDPVPLRDRDEGRRARRASSSRAIARSGRRRARFADGTLKLDYDFLNTTLEPTLEGDQLSGTYIEQAPERAAAGGPRRAGSRRSPRIRREPPQLAGNWEMRRKAEEATAAARHAHVAPVPAAVGRRSVGRDSARRRRHGHAGRPLAERQAGAEPLRRRASEPLRGDAPTRTARSPSRSTATRTIWSSRSSRGARQGHSRAAGSVALHEREGSDGAVPFQRFPDVDRQDGLGHRREVSRQGGHARHRRQLVPELPRRGAVPLRAVQGLPREGARDRRPDVRERSGSGRLRPRVQSFIKRYSVQYPLLIRRHDAARHRARSCRSSSTSARIRRRSTWGATAGSAACTPASRARRPARSTCG